MKPKRKPVHPAVAWLIAVLFLSPLVLVPTGLSLLVEGVEDRQALTFNGNQALYDAMHDRDLNRMRALLDGGASANSRSVGLRANILPSDYGRPVYHPYPPLVTAIDMGRVDMVRLLLDKGADPNWRGKVRGATPLMIAARNGQAPAVQVLIERGVDPNQKDNNGWTALFYGASHVEVVEVLLARGADIHVTAKDGRTAMEHSIKPEAIAVLKQAGAKGDRPPVPGATR